LYTQNLCTEIGVRTFVNSTPGHVTRGWLGRPKSTLQSTSQSVQPFSRSTSVWPAYRRHHSICSKRPRL